jgi:hypothetical protein
MKLLSHLMKLLHLMTLPSQQFCLCGTLFNVHDTLMKHALRLALSTTNLGMNKTGPYIYFIEPRHSPITHSLIWL